MICNVILQNFIWSTRVPKPQWHILNHSFISSEWSFGNDDVYIQCPKELFKLIYIVLNNLIVFIMVLHITNKHPQLTTNVPKWWTIQFFLQKAKPISFSPIQNVKLMINPAQIPCLSDTKYKVKLYNTLDFFIPQINLVTLLVIICLSFNFNVLGIPISYCKYW